MAYSYCSILLDMPMWEQICSIQSMTTVQLRILSKTGIPPGKRNSCLLEIRPAYFVCVEFFYYNLRKFSLIDIYR
jgi:hypothetical protein